MVLKIEPFNELEKGEVQVFEVGSGFDSRLDRDEVVINLTFN